MSNKRFENEIKAAFASETPDALSDIMQACEREWENPQSAEQVARPFSAKRKKARVCAFSCVAAAVLLVFSLGILLGNFIGINSYTPDKFGDTVGSAGGAEGSGTETPGGGDMEGSGAETPGGGETDGSGTETPGGGETDGSGTETPGGGETDGSDTETPVIELASLFIDVNPSVELQVNTEGKVVACIAGNADAETMLGDMKLAGLDMKTALYAIIGAMYMNGFLTSEENSMLVSMKSESEKFETLLSDVVENVNDIMEASEISCSIVAQDVSEDAGSEDVAKENNISVGKLSLINKIIKDTDDYTDEDVSELSKLTIKDLNRLFAYVKESDQQESGANPNPPEVNENHGKDEIFSDIFGAEELAVALAVAHLEEQLSVEISDAELIGLNVRLSKLETSSRFEIKIAYKVTFIYGESLYIYKVDTDTEHAELLTSQPINPFDPIFGGIGEKGYGRGNGHVE